MLFIPRNLKFQAFSQDTVGNLLLSNATLDLNLRKKSIYFWRYMDDGRISISGKVNACHSGHALQGVVSGPAAWHHSPAVVLSMWLSCDKSCCSQTCWWCLTSNHLPTNFCFKLNGGQSLMSKTVGEMWYQLTSLANHQGLSLNQGRA